MNFFLKIVFLFFIGCELGWGLEVLFRRFISKNNPERRWINPGFLIGPYLPLYGTGLVALYLMASVDSSFIKNIYLRDFAIFFRKSRIVVRQYSNLWKRKHYIAMWRAKHRLRRKRPC